MISIYVYSLLLVLVTAAVSFTAAAFFPLYSRPRTTRKTLQTRPRHLVEKLNDCPYEYILQIYGPQHFRVFIDKLDPALKFTNPKRWEMISEIMDVVHFTAILVDDITDDSDTRRGFPAAHKFYGASETANRAYLQLLRMIDKTARLFPDLLGSLIFNLVEIMEGQDMSLVWRRDGVSSLPRSHEERVSAYRHSASLKTGALFRLCGQLVAGDGRWDEVMERVGWYSQLQNDCKNVYSSDYGTGKGAAAEDLRNGEFSYPIIIGLNQPEGYLVEKALGSNNERTLRKALKVLRSAGVKQVCLPELEEVGRGIREWVELWGRKEKMDKVKC